MISHVHNASSRTRRTTAGSAPRSAGARWLALGFVAPLCAALYAQTGAGGAPPPAANPAGEIKVSQPQGGSRLITVPVSKGVLVDFSVPVREVRLANPAIAEVAATNPKQILI